MKNLVGSIKEQRKYFMNLIVTVFRLHRHKREDAILPSLAKGRPLETGHAYRTLYWICRLLGVCLLGSFIINFCFCMLFFDLFPLKKVEPLLVTFSPQTEQIVQIEPIATHTEGFALMVESLSREYVKLREDIDLQTEEMRWQKIFNFSAPEVFQAFKQLMSREGEGLFSKRKNRGLTRHVSIRSVATLSKLPYIVQVDWDSVDYENGVKTKVQSWVSTLTIKFETHRVKFEERYHNPCGFYVTTYGVGEKSPQGEQNDPL